MEISPYEGRSVRSVSIREIRAHPSTEWPALRLLRDNARSLRRQGTLDECRVAAVLYGSPRRLTEVSDADGSRTERERRGAQRRPRELPLRVHHPRRHGRGSG